MIRDRCQCKYVFSKRALLLGAALCWHDCATFWWRAQVRLTKMSSPDAAAYVLEQEKFKKHDGMEYWQYMVAGSFAGMMEHMAMFPVDTVKTRLQIARDALARKALPALLWQDGLLPLYRGIGAVGLGAGPAHAVYFTIYEIGKEKLGGNLPGHHPVAHGTAGALATVASDAVLTPMDVVKQRLQLRRSPYKGVVDCVSRMFREEGLRAFYTSYRTTVVMNVPFTAVHFATYEAAKKLLRRPGETEADEERFMTHLTAGGAAGALASAVTTPLDVVKTKLQCQGVCGSDRFQSGSVKAALRHIVRAEGTGALFRGLGPRVLFHTPAAAICWSSYEAGKSWLHHWGAE